MGMSQEAFVSRHLQGWQDLEELLDRLESGKIDRPVASFPGDYRRVCRHLAMARSRGYSQGVRVRLERIVERGYAALYRHRKDPWERIWEYVAGGFARDVRNQWPSLITACVFFWGTAAVCWLWVWAEPHMAAELLGIDELALYERMHTRELEDIREAESDLVMFGYYIFNNAGIGLRSFGAGLFFGVGSLLILFINGVVFGSVLSHMTNIGHGLQLFSFVIGHGAFELPAIVLSGMAGLKIGAAPIWPGRRRRLEAMMAAARESLGIIFGFTVMFIIAAVIEAFWSPQGFAGIGGRLAVGAVLWGLVVAYFAFAGRGRRGA